MKIFVSFHYVASVRRYSGSSYILLYNLHCEWGFYCAYFIFIWLGDFFLPFPFILRTKCKVNVVFIWSVIKFLKSCVLKIDFPLSFSLWSLASANHRTHRHSHHGKFNSDDRNYTRISIIHTDTEKCSKLRRFRWIFHFSSIPSEHKPMLINVYSAQASVMNKFAEHFLLHIHTNTTHTTSTLCDDEWRK